MLADAINLMKNSITPALAGEFDNVSQTPMVVN